MHRVKEYFKCVWEKRHFPKGGINTERKTSGKGGNELEHFGLSPIWLKSKKKNRKKRSFRQKKLHFKGNFYLSEKTNFKTFQAMFGKGS